MYKEVEALKRKTLYSYSYGTIVLQAHSDIFAREDT